MHSHMRYLSETGYLRHESVCPLRLIAWLILGFCVVFPALSNAETLIGQQTDQPAEQTSQPAQQPNSDQPPPQVNQNSGQDGEPVAYEPQGGIAHSHPAPPAEPPDFLSFLDPSRDYVSEKIVSYAREIDQYFAGDRNFQESNKSTVQLDLSRTMGQLGDDKFVLSGRAKLDLPATERRLHMLLETDPDKNISGVTPQGEVAPPNGTTSPESYSAALRYDKSEDDKKPKYFSADAGVKMSGLALHPFGRVRASFSAPIDEWRVKASETVFWFDTTGTGETTQVDVEHLFSEPVMFRATTTATWAALNAGFNFRQDFSIYHTVDERDAILYQASIVGVSRPVSQVTDTALLLQYRRRLHRRWMFLEIIPQIHFPQTRNYHLSTMLFMRLEVNFDESM